MIDYIIHDEWEIIEEGFDPNRNLISESLFSIGNGYMGIRGNFEEDYSGESLPGSYIGGIYYPDKTKVGWWKIGYPEYFAKVLNACNWIGIRVRVDGVSIDIAQLEVLDFECRLQMKTGLLKRSMTLKLPNNNRVHINSERYICMHQKEIAAISYQITLLDQGGVVTIAPYLDFDVINLDTHYNEKFWKKIDQSNVQDVGYVTCQTEKTNFKVSCAMHNSFYVNNELINKDKNFHTRNKYIEESSEFTLVAGDALKVEKRVALVHSLSVEDDQVQQSCIQLLTDRVHEWSYQSERDQHILWWTNKWSDADIIIEGDVAAQQGIRFNIFQLYQTYTGEDPRLNIGPKGFTGEKYGGSTYWDTEAYCLPFYLSTADPQIARNLLIYRHNHLDKAIENAKKLGFKNGAALYPMVTMNGEECHNEWEITFEEIHRNGAIVYAIYDYIRYTGDDQYMEQYGLDVVVAVARFWAQRVNYSQQKKAYVILGVTGPNEYENNVNNNWYTNVLAKWCLEYAAQEVRSFMEGTSSFLADKISHLRLNQSELDNWLEISDNIYFPKDEKRQIFLQQDNFLDKEMSVVADIDSDHLPLCQNWSWDRILRSPYIKQADVLQGIYFFEDQYTLEEIRRNFQFYEPRTVHESSLSPCIHSILATAIGEHDLAYAMYLRTARLDLEDYNNDTEDGCHITSMAGTWLSIVKGFGGMRIRNNSLYLSPTLPSKWTRYQFKLKFRGHTINIDVTQDTVAVAKDSVQNLKIYVYNDPVILREKELSKVIMKKTLSVAN